LDISHFLAIEEMPAIPLYFYVNDVCVSKKLSGVIFPPFGVMAEFKWAKKIKKVIFRPGKLFYLAFLYYAI